MNIITTETAGNKHDSARRPFAVRIPKHIILGVGVVVDLICAYATYCV